jgi:hypothetical protein
MKLKAYLHRLNDTPDSITFSDTMEVIEANYEFNPTSFKNAALLNEAGKNNGSCKLFSFARIHNLSQQQTLQCFGDYYRKDVLLNPEGVDHQNIRNFIATGWPEIEFYGSALKPKIL